MSTADSDALEELVAHYLDRSEDEPDLAPEAFAAEHPGQAAALLESIAAARAARSLLEATRPDVPDRIGPYRVVAPLGSGGMGVVYAVERDGRRHALKWLAPGLAATGRARERFQREARSLARLAHPGIVRIHDTGVFQDAPYLVMEHVEGPTLAELDLPLAPERAAALVRALALAVEAAHEAGVLHRDLKPANVILRPEGTPVLLDFGLGDAENELTLTSSGALLGTPRYMAPEQAAGLPAERRTDVHALGLILHELLHGAPAHGEGSRAEVLERVRRGRVRRPERSRVPRPLRRVLASALAREPRRRPASAGALAEDLGRFLAGEPVRARPPRPDQLLADELRRRPARALAVLAVLLLAIFAARLAWHARGERAELTRARDAHLDGALCAWMQGDEALARTELERARALDPRDATAPALTAALWSDGVLPDDALPSGPRWIARGLVPLVHGNASAGVLELAAAARASPLPAALHARALALAGEAQEALDAARAARERFPDSPCVLAESARLLEERGETAEALALLRARPLEHEPVPLLAARARLALAEGDPDGAVDAALRAGERIAREGGDPLAELPRLLDLTEASPATLAALARERERGDAHGWISFALAYARDSAHEIVAAAAAYAQALERDPRLLRAHLNLAHLYAGAQLGACQACDRAYGAAPEMLSPDRALEHLRLALEQDRGEGETVVGRIVQTALALSARAPESRARAEVEALVRGMLERPELSAGGKRRLQEGLARLEEAGSGAPD